MNSVSPSDLLRSSVSLVNIIVIAEECFKIGGLTRKEILRINNLTYRADLDPVFKILQQTYAANFIHLRRSRYTLINHEKDYGAEKRLEALKLLIECDPAEIFTPNSQYKADA